MKLNKNGVYVLDQKEVRDQRNTDTLTIALAALGQSDLHSHTSSPPDRIPVTLNGHESEGSSDRIVNVRTIQSIIRNLL